MDSETTEVYELSNSKTASTNVINITDMVYEHNSINEHLSNTTKRQFKLFKNQVAGHLPILYDTQNGVLLKPAPSKEIEFYQNIKDWFPQILPFIPKCSGVEQLSTEVIPKPALMMNVNNSSTDNKHNGDESPNWAERCMNRNGERIKNMPFLILENITDPYVHPCVLDLKIGIRHFAAFCDLNKKRRKLKKAWMSTNRHLGVRVAGMQLYNAQNKTYDLLQKYQGINLSINDFCSKFQLFFTDIITNQIRSDLIHKCIKKIKSLQNVLQNETRYRWFSCSLLFVYEGEHISASITPPTVFTDDDSDIHSFIFINKSVSNNTLSHHFQPSRFDFRLIDFSNFVIVKNYEKELLQISRTHNRMLTIGQSNECCAENICLSSSLSLSSSSMSTLNSSFSISPSNSKTKAFQLDVNLDSECEVDHGILFGLASVFALLTELKDNGHIHKRNAEEWKHFRDSITYSTKALSSFAEFDFEHEITFETNGKINIDRK